MRKKSNTDLKAVVDYRDKPVEQYFLRVELLTSIITVGEKKGGALDAIDPLVPTVIYIGV